MSERSVRRLIGLLLVGATAVAVAGCGISPSEPRRIGNGLVPGPGLGSDIQIPAPGPEPGAPTKTVENYFGAAVGGGDAAVQNVQSFLTQNWRSKWVPGSQLTIVRNLRIDPEGALTDRTVTVTGRYQRVGVLTDQGVLDDVSEEPQFVPFTFTLVAGENASQWSIDSGPQGMLLSDVALGRYYRDRPIYFWDANRQRLVPDLRYLALTTAPSTRPNMIVDWLINGPSRWLGQSVRRLPAGTKLKSAITKNSANELVVNLSAAAVGADPEDLQRLADQLQWSLRTDSFPAIELQIEEQPKAVDGSAERYLKVAPAVSRAERFGVTEGKLVPLPVGSQGSMAVLASTANRNVVSAAVTRDPNRVAFVRRAGNGTLYLSIQRSGEGTLPQPAEVGLGRTDSVTRPAWLPGATDGLVIAAAGRLYAVTGSGGPTSITPDGVSGVTAVSVAPEGRRIAYIAHGRAYVAALVVNGSVVRVENQQRPLLPGQLDATGIAWTSEDRVIVAGSANNKAALWHVRADGGVAEDLSPAESARIDRLIDVVAYPQSPVGPKTSVEAMVQTAAVAYNLYGRSLSAETGALWPCYAQ